MARRPRHGRLSQVVVARITTRATRLLGYLIVLWLGATANFLLPRLLPGDPVEFLIGEESGRLTAHQRSAVLSQFGLDRPLIEQYGRYWGGDRKSTRLNSSHRCISYAVFCLKKKKKHKVRSSKSNR